MRHPHGTTSRTARALRTSAVGAVSATLVAGTALGLAPAAQAASGATDTPTTRFVDIKGDGGTVLKANVVAPADTSRAYPLLVLPTSWGLPQIEYLTQARKLADAGHIGMAGLSYGAGISLLTASHDKRARAVATPRSAAKRSRTVSPYCYVGHVGGGSQGVNAPSSSRSWSGGREGRRRTGMTCRTSRSDPGKNPHISGGELQGGRTQHGHAPDTVIGARQLPGPLL